MDLIQEVLAFSRDYVNGNVTKERKYKIAAAYKRLTGENLRISCGTCFIEAIFKIKKIMERVPCNYRLKPGALLRAFGDESKTCTNANLTDELAEYHLRTNPGCIKLFSVPSEPIIREMFYENAKELEYMPIETTVIPPKLEPIVHAEKSEVNEFKSSVAPFQKKTRKPRK
jgi:hypothetical protein